MDRWSFLTVGEWTEEGVFYTLLFHINSTKYNKSNKNKQT